MWVCIDDCVSVLLLVLLQSAASKRERERERQRAKEDKLQEAIINKNNLSTYLNRYEQIFVFFS